MMIVKVHGLDRKVMSLCDQDILGKYFEEGKLQLDLTSSFYKGEVKSKEEILVMIEDVVCINAVGKNSVSFLLEKQLITKHGIKKVADIPYAQAT